MVICQGCEVANGLFMEDVSDYPIIQQSFEQATLVSFAPYEGEHILILLFVTFGC